MRVEQGQAVGVGAAGLGGADQEVPARRVPHLEGLVGEGQPPGPRMAEGLGPAAQPADADPTPAVHIATKHAGHSAHTR